MGLLAYAPPTGNIKTSVRANYSYQMSCCCRWSLEEWQADEPNNRAQAQGGNKDGDGRSECIHLAPGMLFPKTRSACGTNFLKSAHVNFCTFCISTFKTPRECVRPIHRGI